MKKLLSVLSIISVMVIAITVNAQDKTLDISAAFGTGASIEIYDSLTGGNVVSSVTFDTTGITFPYVDPNDNDAVTDPHLVGQVFVEVSAGTGTAWNVAIYTNSNDPTSSSINHPFDNTQTIRLKYNSDVKQTGNPVPGGTITEADWNDSAQYSWLLNLTDAELTAGGLANLDSATLSFATFIPNGVYTSRIALTFAIGLHDNVTASGDYSNKLGLEVYTN